MQLVMYVPHSVVTDEDGLEPPQQRKAVKFPNFIVRQVDGVKLVLKQERNKTGLKQSQIKCRCSVKRVISDTVFISSPTKVAPRFSITAILFPTLRQKRKSDCTTHKNTRQAD